LYQSKTDNLRIQLKTSTQCIHFPIIIYSGWYNIIWSICTSKQKKISKNIDDFIASKQMNFYHLQYASWNDWNDKILSSILSFIINEKILSTLIENISMNELFSSQMHWILLKNFLPVIIYICIYYIIKTQK